LKIAIVAPKVYPVFNQSADDTYGGAEIALNLVARELSQFDNIEVYVLVGDYGQAESEKAGRITLRRALDADGSTLSNGFRLLSVMNNVGADVYIQRTLTVASALIALYCLFWRRRFIYWVAHDRETDGGHPLYSRTITRLVIRLLFRLASHVIVQNEYESNQLQKQFPGIKCSVVKKGIELPMNTSFVDELYDAIWVGRCDEWKNPEIFIELAKSHPSKRFLIICPPALGKEEYYQQFIKTASCCPNLEVRGRTKNREVLDLVHKSRVFCNTSSQEGDWPVVVLEAASLRRPILSLHLEYGGLVGDYGGGKSCNGDFARFSSEFQRLIRNELRRREMGDGAYEYIKEIHDVQKQTAQLVKLINELA